MSVLDERQVLRHGAFAVVIGVVGAIASIVLCLLVGLAYDLLLDHRWFLYLLPLLGVASLVLYHRLGLALDTTTHTVVNHIRTDRPISPWLAPGILIGTALSVLGGASVGKEAGALHMGASLGDTVARPFKLRPVFRSDQAADPAHDKGMRSYAAATGMAATFAALFFAPLGSAAFVVELTRYKREVTRHLPTMLLACFVAFLIARAIGIGDVIPAVEFPALSWPLVGQCLAVAVVCAVGGTLYIKAIEGLQNATKRLSRNYYLWAALAGVLMIALVSLFGWESFEGTGANQLSLALAGKQESWAFAVKGLLTVVCLGLWLRGGEIMPTFTVGALLGASCTVMTGGDPGPSAAIGLVAFFAAMSRCPLAAFLMGCEIFGWYAAPLFALAVAVSSSLGGDVGYYGRGALSTIHGTLRHYAAGRRQVAEKRAAAAGVNDVVERARNGVEAVEDELESRGDGTGRGGSE